MPFLVVTCPGRSPSPDMSDPDTFHVKVLLFLGELR
jgi:hypothetical protein